MEKTINGWIARDKDYRLHFFYTEPKRYEDFGEWSSGGERFHIPSELSDVLWNDEPRQATLTID